MKELNALLQSCTTDSEKIDFMYDEFIKLQSKVEEVLLFGPSNNDAAEEAKKVFYQREKQGQGSFFSGQYTNKERLALPAVIAQSLSLATESQIIESPAEQYESYLKSAYLYGAGTCEYYAIVGAYFLAVEFNVDLSIETIYSHESHTYIKLHTSPEFIMDFWSPMLCQHNDTVSWNEFFGFRYIRNSSSEIKENIQFNREELLALGARVFSEQNRELRLQIIDKVVLRAQQESAVKTSDENSDICFKK